MELSQDDATLLEIGEGTETQKVNLLVPGKAFYITKPGKKGASYLCNTRAFNNETKLQFKSGWLWVKRYKGTEYCLFFWDVNSETFINVSDNDKSVLISISKKSRWRRSQTILKLFDTNKYAPGPHPYKVGGSSGSQLVTNDTSANILCYKALNNYALRTDAWVKANPYKTRHHKNCDFNLFYVPFDPKKLVPKKKWRDADEDDGKDDEKEADDEGDENEKTGKKPTSKKPSDEKPDEDEEEDDVKEQPTKHKPHTPKPKPYTPPPKEVTKPEPVAPKKGELNPEVGLYVERPFYI